jgi:Lon protease-like protein
LLALFPLNVVLFPATEIPLHIFEERYKEMIGECLETRVEFGVVLAQEQGVVSTGCTAAITQILRKFDDGRMDIVVRGQRRFELVRLDQEKSYLRGEAQFFGDEGGAVAPADPRRRQALDLFEKLSDKFSVERSGSAPLDAAEPQLSFQIASRLPVELPFRQVLLQLRSENDRLERLLSYLERMLLRVERLSEAQVRAGANGRGR